MSLKYRIEKLLQLLPDGIYAVLPQPKPDLETVKNCKIVSHRGEHRGKDIRENTLAAFDRALQHNIWGIEFDIRWTADLQPVIIHDPDCKRVFGEHLTISQTSLAELRSRVPLIPTLSQVVERYGGKLHLMAEIKEEPFPNPQHQRNSLEKPFSLLTPAKDFHLLALNPDIFRLVDFVPKKALLPVAEYNFRALSDMALREKYAGISGHYLLVSNKLIRRHVDADQKTGTGFTRSRQCFHRELNRGVTWIFTNHAEKLDGFRQELLRYYNSC